MKELVDSLYDTRDSERVDVLLDTVGALAGQLSRGNRQGNTSWAQVFLDSLDTSFWEMLKGEHNFKLTLQMSTGNWKHF